MTPRRSAVAAADQEAAARLPGGASASPAPAKPVSAECGQRGFRRWTAEDEGCGHIAAPLPGDAWRRSPVRATSPTANPTAPVGTVGAGAGDRVLIP